MPMKLTGVRMRASHQGLAKSLKNPVLYHGLSHVTVLSEVGSSTLS